MLTFSLSNLTPLSSSPSKSTSFFLLRSKDQSRSIQSIRMEASSATVPSIVVYVSVPNKEAGRVK